MASSLKSFTNSDLLRFARVLWYSKVSTNLVVVHLCVYRFYRSCTMYTYASCQISLG